MSALVDAESWSLARTRKADLLRAAPLHAIGSVTMFWVIQRIAAL
ncbi:MAG TPA: hypothetical protein VGO25_13115 [Rhodanobacteraceae bacterium]|nr:hypothetical protein [Rhodanobacteraceae bacterium]